MFRVRTAHGAVEVAGEAEHVGKRDKVGARADRRQAAGEKQTSGEAEKQAGCRGGSRPRPRRTGNGGCVFSGHNATLHGLLPEGNKERALTTDGNDKHAYRGPAVWAPDSRHFAVWKARDVPERKVHLREASPEGQEQPRHSTYP